MVYREVYTMSYTDEQIEKLRRMLHDQPEKERTRHSKVEVVRILLPEIIGLQRKGYTISMIAELLHAQGIDISTRTLTQYIGQAKRQARQQTRKRGPAVASPVAPPVASNGPSQKKPAQKPTQKPAQKPVIDDDEI
jgi:hypothetical protein